MAGQPGLFDPAPDPEPDRKIVDLQRARAKRDAGMARAEAGADDEWRTLAELTLAAYLVDHEEFFVDDFWRDTGLATPREARALGPIILAAARAGYIEKTGEFRPSVRSNLAVRPVWRSKLYRGSTP